MEKFPGGPESNTMPGMHRMLCVSLLLGSALCWPLPATAQLTADAYESPPVLDAGSLLPADMLQSSAHRVHNEVDVDGDMLRFRIESDYGNYEVPSEGLLRIRVREIETLAQAIDQFNRSNHKFAARLRGELRVGADSWLDIVTSPLSTASNLAGQLTHNVGQTLEELGSFSNPAAGRAVQKAPAYAGMMPDDAALAAYKRNVARELRLDPYSTNPRVQSFLDTVAKARASGRAGTGALAVSLPRDDAPARVDGGRVDAAVWAALAQYTPADLDAEIADTLRGMRIPVPLIKAFIAQPHLSPHHKSVIVAYLEYLAGVPGRALVLRAALSARDERDAVSFEQMVRMLALYQDRVARIKALHPGGGVPVAVTTHGVAVVALPVDIVWWNAQADRAFTHLTEVEHREGLRHVEVLIPGVLTSLARKQLARRGITVRERFLYHP